MSKQQERAMLKRLAAAATSPERKAVLEDLAADAEIAVIRAKMKRRRGPNLDGLFRQGKISPAHYRQIKRSLQARTVRGAERRTTGPRGDYHAR